MSPLRGVVPGVAGEMWWPECSKEVHSGYNFGDPGRGRADAVVVGMVEQWPSLCDQVVVAERLFGPTGPRVVGEWVAEQVGFAGDGNLKSTSGFEASSRH